jgi:branched-chain amino acid transport system permease protein
VQTLVNSLYLVLFSIGLFVLISLGLAVIFGLMRVINLAQGEFIMLGAYVCALSSNRGLPLWLASLLAALAVGLFGILVERLIIRWLYGRIIDTLLATWGLSLFLVGGITTLFGPQAESVAAALGSISIGGVTISLYNLIVIAIALLMLALTWALFRLTTFGLLVRGTMQNATMASALGVPKERIYMLTFGLGSALTGLAGAVLVPITGVAPTMGVFFVAKAFITVIAGGPLPLLGTVSAASLFGAIDGAVSFLLSSVVGEISVLLVAILLLRMLPHGITGRLRRGL